MIVIGISNDRLRERMLREPNLTLEQAISFGQTAEEMAKHVKEIQHDEELRVQAISAKKKQDHPAKNSKHETSKFSNDNMIIQCKFCSYSHRRGSCLAYQKKCHKCGKKGHFSNCCKSKQINTIDDDETDENPFFVGAIFAEPEEPSTDESSPDT